MAGFGCAPAVFPYHLPLHDGACLRYVLRLGCGVVMFGVRQLLPIIFRRVMQDVAAEDHGRGRGSPSAD